MGLGKGEQGLPLTFVLFYFYNNDNNNKGSGSSLLVQWFQIFFSIKGTRVQSLVGELRSHTPWGN